MTTSHKGSCFCGAVQIEVSGNPVAMAYCHCNSCRSWSGSPVHASTMWPFDAVDVLSGAECVATFHKTPQSISHRQYCRKCGGHLPMDDGLPKFRDFPVEMGGSGELV